MIEQEIVSYIIQAQKHGLSEVEIKQNLLTVGWEAGVVEESFVFAKASDSKTVLADPKGATQHREMPAELIKMHATDLKGKDREEPITAPSVVLTEQHFQTKPTTNSGIKKPLLFIFIFLGLILLGGGAYGYYNFVYTSPTKTWGKFLTTKQTPIYKVAYNLTYKNSGSSTSTNIALSISGNSHVNQNDANNIKFESETKFSAKNEGVEAAFTLNYLIANQVFYLNVGKIDLLKNLTGDKNIEWLKIDLNELKKYSENFAQTSNNQDSEKIKEKLKEIWTNTKLIANSKFVEKESNSGVVLYHYKAELDIQAFSSAVLETINLVSEESSQNIPEPEKQAFIAFIKKFKAKELDIWVGQKDNQLYKLNLIINAPSVEDFENPAVQGLSGALNSAREKSRDAKRLADVRQLASALELYFNSAGGYPAANSNGQPENLTPDYLGIIPTSPTPPDGKCTDYYNPYWYTPEGTPKKQNGAEAYPSYNITFCLGSDAGGYSAGIAKISPAGLISSIACPTTSEQCVNTQVPHEASLIDAINQMNFNGQININLDYSDFGKDFEVKIPENSTDIMKMFNESPLPLPAT